MGYKGNFPQIMREAGFKLRQYRDGPLDWRLMGAYETDRILREQNFEMVDDALQHLSEAPLGTALETHILDSGIAKYFIMSQYAIQYLLYCRTYLDENVGELREAHATAQQEIAKLRQSLGESNNEVIQLHKKITQIEAIREVVFPCHLCTKNFISNDALNVHIGRKHRVGTPTTNLPGGSGSKDKDNDVQLINTIKMELEIKQLKERLNAAERNIKERSTSSRHHASPRQDQSTGTTQVRTVGIQSNLAEYKEKDEHSSEAIGSEASERKEQLHGLAERLSNFEVWQTQLKQSNDQFIQDINHKLEDLSHALEQTKLRAESKITTVAAATTEDRVATPCLEDLERILSEKVAEIGKVSANKLEEVVYQLEMGYKEKLEALERELKRLTEHKESNVITQSVSKIPKPLPKKEETNLERIKRQVETEFLKTKHDDDTYSIEELPAEPKREPEQQQQSAQKQLVTQVQELPSRSSSGSHPTFTKPAAELESKLKSKPIVSQPETIETTDISESLSEEEETISEEPSDFFTSEPERQVFQMPKSKAAAKAKSPQKPQQPLTRKDARKLVNHKLNPHGFNMKSKSISGISLKRVSAELVQHRNNFRLDNPHFYATRNRIRKFVDKLCSAKMPPTAQLMLKHKTPIQPSDDGGKSLTGTTQNDEDGDDDLETPDRTSSQEEDDPLELSPTSSSSPQQRQQHRNFKAQLEQMLAKPAARVVSKTGTTQVQLHAARPVPLPRKRVMFNTMGIDKSLNDEDEEIK
ncbi:cilium assembly protein DZIP1L isoform X1 [Drosophila albomicans]|uniref:Cilium assembly protein DZIP1L isoform X1 n=1 Tax=Drosophila albomicans TaxID=7291 RepID=A0A6P8XMW2_DROAB|nr:cilium assembly protein DZIP1L isoform X1 [Drosophila albomicans]